MIKLIDILLESIKASEAYSDEGSIQTVIDGKRKLGFAVLEASSNMTAKEIEELFKKGKLETIEVKGNPSDARIYYNPRMQGAKEDALELKKIAEKYGGYLAYNASDKDSRRIGELLGYDKEDIDAYIEKNKHKAKLSL